MTNNTAPSSSSVQQSNESLARGDSSPVIDEERPHEVTEAQAVLTDFCARDEAVLDEVRFHVFDMYYRGFQCQVPYLRLNWLVLQSQDFARKVNRAELVQLIRDVRGEGQDLDDITLAQKVAVRIVYRDGAKHLTQAYRRDRPWGRGS